MAVHLKIVETFEPQIHPALEKRRPGDSQGDLRLRLIRAFSQISDEQARLRIVKAAEEASDPIWDY